MTDLAEKLIAEEEGRERQVYKDSEGYWSIGIGCLVDPKFAGSGLCDAAIDAQFAHDSASARTEAAAIAGYDKLNDIQRAVIVSMCFQLGSLAGWHQFKAFLAAGDVKGAAQDARQQLWYRQTPNRAEREMRMLESGQWVERITE